MTQRYSVSGTLVPDATTPDTGPPAGTHEGQDYWRWLVGEREWFLYWWGTRWQITDAIRPADSQAFGDVVWRGDEEIVGDYTAGTNATGTATVAEYEESEPEPGPEKLLVLEWLTGPHAGKYTLLKESI